MVPQARVTEVDLLKAACIWTMYDPRLNAERFYYIANVFREMW